MAGDPAELGYVVEDVRAARLQQRGVVGDLPRPPSCWAEREGRPGVDRSDARFGPRRGDEAHPVQDPTEGIGREINLVARSQRLSRRVRPGYGVVARNESNPSPSRLRWDETDFTERCAANCSTSTVRPHGRGNGSCSTYTPAGHGAVSPEGGATGAARNSCIVSISFLRRIEMRAAA